METLTQKPHPFDIPEVLFSIARYLKAKHLVAFSHVCKSLRAWLAPLLWKNVELGNSFVYRIRTNQKPMSMVMPFPSRDHAGQPIQEDTLQQALQANASWIRSLAVLVHRSSPQLTFGAHCTMLDSLILQYYPFRGNIDRTYWDNLQLLLEQNVRCLRSLTLNDWAMPRHVDQPPPINAKFARNSNLCSLTLSSCRIESESMCHFWSISQQLESLEIRNTFLSLPTGSPPTRNGNSEGNSEDNSESNQDICAAYGATTSDARFPKLRKLIVDNVSNWRPREQLEWLIKSCPLLETLNWDMSDSLFPEDEFSDSFASMTWPNLVSITILDYERHYVSDENYMTILRTAKQPLRFLDIKIARLTRPAFDLILKHHFETITEIDLTNAQEPNQDSKTFVPERYSMWVQEVLESCYSLERLVARIISSNDIINGKPWVCRRLKCLQVAINMNFKDKPTERGRKRPKFTEDEERVCRGVFGQLSRLVSLKSLGKEYHSGLWRLAAKKFALPLELRLGLGQLSQLKNIESIWLFGNQDMRMIDIQWMMEHWPRLRYVYGGNLSAKRSRTFENLYVRDYLLHQALWMREIRGPNNSPEEFKRIGKKGCVHDSDSECDSDED